MKTMWWRVAARACLFLPAFPAMAQQADVSILSISTAPTALAGSHVRYQIVPRQNGPGDAQGVVLTHVLPAGTTFVSFAQTQGPVFSCTTPPVGAGGSITCKRATWARNASAPLPSFTVLVATTGAMAGTSMDITASVAAATSDLNLANDSRTFRVAILHPATPWDDAPPRAAMTK